MKQVQQTKKQVESYMDMFSDEIQVQYFPAKHGTYKANLFGPITSPSQFSQIVTVLEIMKEDDDLVLYLSSGGGSLGAVDSLLHAMRKTEGTIHCVCTGDVSSAATFVLLESDSFELSDGFEATLHCGSLGYGGNYNEVATSAPFQLQHMQSFLRRAYEGFIDEERLEALFKGQDILLNAEQWMECADARQKYFQAKYEAQQAAEQAALEAMQQEHTSKPRPQKRPLSLGKLNAVQGPQNVVE